MVDFRLFVIFILYLTIMSGFIGAVVYGKEHQALEKFSVEGINYNVINKMDFTSNQSYIASNIYGMTGFSGVWKQSDIGITLTETSYGDEPVIVINNAIPVNDVYTNIYHINNSVKGDFSVWLRYTASYLNSGDKLSVFFDSYGIHIRSEFLGFPSDIYVYPYPDINQIDDLSIKTEYNDKIGSVSVTVNDNLLFTTPDLPHLTIISLSRYYYAGVSSRNEGFTFISVNGKFSDTSISTSGISTILDFSGHIISALTWQVPTEYLPVEYAFALIGLPEIILFILVLALIFGR